MDYSIQAKKRAQGNPEEVRAQSMVPGVIYGSERESTPIQVNSLELQKLYEGAGASNLIEFKLEDESPVQVMIQDLQRDSIKGTITHIDFFQIKAGQALDVVIPLRFVGESMAVKQGGSLMTPIFEINAKCLPKDLISELEVDISALKTFDDSITIKDLNISKDIEITDDGGSLVAKVNAPLSEEQLKQREEADQVSAPAEAPEVDGEKKEGEEATDEKPAEEKKEA